MEKFTPLAKILHCCRHWRHGQIPHLFCICSWFVLWCHFICDSICVLYIFFGTINVFVLLEQSPPSLQSFELITIIIIIDILILIDDHRGLVWVSSRGKKDSLPNGCRRPFASTALVRMILECESERADLIWILQVWSVVETLGKKLAKNLYWQLCIAIEAAVMSKLSDCHVFCNLPPISQQLSGQTRNGNHGKKWAPTLLASLTDHSTRRGSLSVFRGGVPF